MKITVITPTADQPTGMRLLLEYMQRQTMPPGQWIVADDGDERADILVAGVPLGTEQICRRRIPGLSGAQSLCGNLLAAIPHVIGDVIIFMEHDDHYAPTHIETMYRQLAGGAALAGDPKQRYYNVSVRAWRDFDNRGASLCQTGMTRAMLPQLESVARTCYAGQNIGVDFRLWHSVDKSRWSLERTNTVLGIKGLPGRKGLGVGHRPTGPLWTQDRDLAYLRAMIGADAEKYAPFMSDTAQTVLQ